ncbi:MAG: ShlB/FhaC/HecB family hemolysin secretion/activation protein [Acidiferrobacteraceae bacterium]
MNNIRMRTCVLAVLMAVASPAVLAAQPIPGAGQLLQQIPSTTSIPISPAPSIRVRRGGVVMRMEHGAPAFFVNRIAVEGNTLLPARLIRSLVAPSEGHVQTLSQIVALTDRLTAAYRAHGYLLDRVIVPPQAIDRGVLTLQVIEARYGQVTLINTSAVRAGMIQDTLSPLHRGALIAAGPLNRRLLILATTPGVVVHPAILSPGRAVGTSDLQVVTSAGPRVTGGISTDNFGNPYTGRTQVLANVTVNNPLHLGDQLTLQGLSTLGPLSYGQIGYSTRVGGDGTRIGALYSALRYRLSGSLAALQAHGSADTTGFTIMQPFVLTPSSTLYGMMRVDHQQVNDFVTSAAIADRRHINSVTTTVFGAEQDRLLWGGRTDYRVSYTSGWVAFDNATAALADAATAHTAGNFDKLDETLSRTQVLPWASTVSVQAIAQESTHNLDEVQQLILGGPGSAPGYPQGEVTGDSGYNLTESLHHVVSGGRTGQWDAQIFENQGRVTFNRVLWPGFSGPNHASMADAGVGLSWHLTHWTSRVQVAWRTHASESALPVSSPVQVWWSLGWQG